MITLKYCIRLPSQCKVRSDDQITDQDEWFNLYLYLGSCWVNTSRDMRLDTILDKITDTKIRTWTKESRSIDRAEIWESHGAGSLHKGVSTEVQLKSKRLRTRILSQFQDHLLEDQFVDRSLHHLPIPKEPGSVCNSVLFRWDGSTRFVKPIFSSLRTGNEVSLTLISKIRHLWNRLINRDHNWPGSGLGIRYYQ